MSITLQIGAFPLCLKYVEVFGFENIYSFTVAYICLLAQPRLTLPLRAQVVLKQCTIAQENGVLVNVRRNGQ